MIRATTRYFVDKAVEDELRNIIRDKPPYHSNHEAWAILHEEIEELGDEMCDIENGETWLWRHVSEDDEQSLQEEKSLMLKTIKNLIAEAVQVAAVLEKFSVREGEDK